MIELQSYNEEEVKRKQMQSFKILAVQSGECKSS